MSFNLYCEAFGSFRYIFPKDPEEQLYDFYMLNMLRGRSALYQKAQQQGVMLVPKKPTFGGELSHEDKLDYMLEEVANILIPQLKKDLLRAVLFSISAETRHVLEASSATDLYTAIYQKLGKKYA